MKKLVRRFVVLALMLSTLFSVPALAADAAETAAFNKVNEIRTMNGLQPLVWDGQIEAAGRVRAEEITRSFSHTRPDGSAWYTADEAVLYGENLAEGYDDAEAVVTAWMSSPLHRANIMKADYRSGAIAVYEQNGRLYWAQEFGF